MSREATTRLLDMVDEGVVDKDQLILACVNYMSEDDVREMCRLNEIFDLEDEDEDDEDEDEEIAAEVERVETIIAAGTRQYDDMGNEIVRMATCGHCGRSWNDAISSELTPVPSARCPFEYAHVYDDEQ